MAFMIKKGGGQYVLGYLHRTLMDSVFHDSVLAIAWNNEPEFAGIISTECGPYIARGRNLLAERFLLNCDAPYLLMVDDDMEIPPDTFKRLVRSANANTIVGGKYYSFNRRTRANQVLMADENLQAMVNWKDGAVIDVGACGTGCMLIPRAVLEKVPKPWFWYENEKEMGEDYAFCVKARSLGVKVKVDTSAFLGHCKGIVIGPQDAGL